MSDPVDNKAALLAALVAAQAELANPPKTRTAKVVHRTGGQHTYQYADLADVIDAVRPVLQKHGLGIMHLMEGAGPARAMVARLYHKDGATIDSVYPVPEAVSAPQDFGSWQTYMRRYSIACFCCVAGEIDDDAATAQEAETAADEAKRSEAAHKLEALKKAASEGRVRSAHDGRQLAPGEDPRPAEAQTAAADELAGIDSRLAEAMRKAGISPEQLKAFYVAKGHMPDSVEPSDLPADYVGVLTKPENWKKAISAIKEAK